MSISHSIHLLLVLSGGIDQPVGRWYPDSARSTSSILRNNRHNLHTPRIPPRRHSNSTELRDTHLGNLSLRRHYSSAGVGLVGIACLAAVVVGHNSVDREDSRPVEERHSLAVGSLLAAEDILLGLLGVGLAHNLEGLESRSILDLTW